MTPCKRGKQGAQWFRTFFQGMRMNKNLWLFFFLGFIGLACTAPVAARMAAPVPLTRPVATTSSSPQPGETVLPTVVVITPMAEVVTTALTVRACPQSDCPAVTWLVKGQRVTFEETERAPDGGIWAHIVAGDVSGWVNMKYLEVQK